MPERSAVVSYIEAIRLKPDNPQAYAAFIRALKAAGKLDQVIADQREAIRRKPDDALAYF